MTADSRGPSMSTHYVALLDEAFDRRSWHGTTLRGSLRRVSVAQAAWRPGANRHNIWEIVVHAAYWKYAVTRRLTGAKRGSFALEGSNWFVRPTERTEAAWRRDIALLEQQHEALRTAVATLGSSVLDAPVRRDRPSAAFLIRGIAAHDLYHAGQIQLLKRLAPERVR